MSQLSKQDWQKLQTPIAVLAIVLIIMSALIGFAHHYSAQQQQALTAQQNQLNSARQRFQSSGMEKDTIIRYLPLYQGLIGKGFIGEERRIEWVDELRAQHQKHKLFGIKYSIAQQEDFKPSFVPNLGGFSMHRSIMNIDLDMLHEGDILQLTESLGAENTSPFMLRDCEIIRLGNNAAMSSQLVANLHAQCELDWITLREPVAALTTVAPIAP
jgi:hypothetical protein